MENNSKTVRGGEGGSTVQTGRSLFFLKSFVKSRPIEARRSERLALQTAQDEQSFWNVEHSSMKTNTKNLLTLVKIFASIQSRGLS